MKSRTDIHRKGAIIPANYDYILSYALPSIWATANVSGLNLNCEMAQFEWQRRSHSGNYCCLFNIHQNNKKAEYGGTGKCTACGATYTYGDVLKHKTTGEIIHLGHDCAEKYGMMVDRSEFELSLDRLREAAAVALTKEIKKEQREKFLAEHPGLEEALTTPHKIVENIQNFFIRTCNLSDKQMELVYKLQKEHNTPKEEEIYAVAPEGKVTFVGELVGWKWQESRFGSVLKATIKVKTDSGVWLAWGSWPSAFMGTDIQEYKGKKLQITATLEKSDTPHFAFMKRPKGKVLEDTPLEIV